MDQAQRRSNLHSAGDYRLLQGKGRLYVNVFTFKRKLKIFIFCTSYNIPTPTLSPQTDILCGFLIVIVSLYSIVF